MLPDKLMETLESEHWKLLLINSEYKTASDEVNAQLDAITGVLKQYDPTGMLIGEAPCTKDMIEVTDEDFRVVNTVSIAAIFIIIALVTRRASPAVYSGGGHRICHLHQPGTALLHQHLAAVYRTDLYQYDPAGRHRGLRHSHDDPV